MSCTELASRARAVLSTSYKWRLFADDVLCIKDCIDRDVAALLRGHHARAVSALITLSAVAPSPPVPFIHSPSRLGLPVRPVARNIFADLSCTAPRSRNHCLVFCNPNRNVFEEGGNCEPILRNNAEIDNLTGQHTLSCDVLSYTDFDVL